MLIWKPASLLTLQRERKSLVTYSYQTVSCGMVTYNHWTGMVERMVECVLQGEMSLLMQFV